MLAWTTPAVLDFLNGPLDQVGDHVVSARGTRLSGDSFPMTRDPGST